MYLELLVANVCQRRVGGDAGRRQEEAANPRVATNVAFVKVTTEEILDVLSSCSTTYSPLQWVAYTAARKKIVVLGPGVRHHAPDVVLIQAHNHALNVDLER